MPVPKLALPEPKLDCGSAAPGCDRFRPYELWDEGCDEPNCWEVWPNGRDWYGVLDVSDRRPNGLLWRLPAGCRPAPFQTSILGLVPGWAVNDPSAKLFADPLGGNPCPPPELVPP